MFLLLSTIISILSFGASPNNSNTNNSIAINKAISACAEQGGGKVIVPNGEFYAGTIYLQSNVTLVLEKGAILKGVKQLDAYAPLQTNLNLTKYESGEGTVNYNSATDPQWSKAMIFAVNIQNAGIEGEGIIDGDNVRNPLGEEHMRGPHTILMAGCNKMRFKDFTINHSANYAILGYQITNTLFANVKINGGWDGIHVRGAKRMTIKNCTIHTGDDALAGGYWDNASISNCILNSSCNGIRMIMPSIQVEIKDCVFEGPGVFEHQTSGKTTTEAAINIQPGGWGKAPGLLDKIYIRDCKIDNVLCPISVTLSEENTAGTIVVENLTGHRINHMALSVKSWGTALTEKIVMRNIDLEFVGKDDPSLPTWFEGKPFSEWPVFPCWGLYFRNVNQLELKNVRLHVKGKDFRKELLADHVKTIKKKGTYEVLKEE